MSTRRRLRGPYPTVKRAHVVPRFWLNLWAVNNQLAMCPVGGTADVLVSVKDAAVRGPFYRRTRRDGSKIDDVEASLAHLESTTAPLFDALTRAWPPTLATKGALAELFAFQIVRGPRWKEWHREFLARSMEERRRDPTITRESGLVVPISAKDLDALESELASDTQWLRRMMSVTPKLITLLGSMTWDLLTFDRDVLVLSDHPVVEWPLGDDMRAPQVFTDHGLANVLEVRLPLTPRALLLMTWRDEEDGTVHECGDDIAANANAFFVAHAERQYMYVAGTVPPCGRGPFPALSVRLNRGYGSRTAEISDVRRRALESVNARAGDDAIGGDTEIIRVTRRASEPWSG